MTLNDISLHRIANQHISGSTLKRPQDLVSYMGAIQAQDFRMSQWAVGIRLPGTTAGEIQAALDKGEMLRTHVLRPTWHLVSADDIHWMLDLTAPRIKQAMKSRHRQLGIDEQVVMKSNRIIEKALTDGPHKTREELALELQKKSIETKADNRLSHLLLLAELDLVICSGALREKQQTYALLDERVPTPRRLPRDEALATLTLRYFTSHGPATLQDFVWWSGLLLTDVKKGVDMVSSMLSSETFNGRTYWFKELHPGSPDRSVHLLPAFDELIISYEDRSASVPASLAKKAISNNGIFWPVMLKNGQVASLWKRTLKKDSVIIEMQELTRSALTGKQHIKKALDTYGRFLNLRVEWRH